MKRALPKRACSGVCSKRDQPSCPPFWGVQHNPTPSALPLQPPHPVAQRVAPNALTLAGAAGGGTRQQRRKPRASGTSPPTPPHPTTRAGPSHRWGWLLYIKFYVGRSVSHVRGRRRRLRTRAGRGRGGVIPRLERSGGSRAASSRAPPPFCPPLACPPPHPPPPSPEKGGGPRQLPTGGRFFRPFFLPPLGPARCRREARQRRRRRRHQTPPPRWWWWWGGAGQAGSRSGSAAASGGAPAAGRRSGASGGCRSAAPWP